MMVEDVNVVVFVLITFLLCVAGCAGAGGAGEARGIPKVVEQSRMVRVPGGEFWMGTRAGEEEEDEKGEMPRRRVYVSAFFIDRYEVTADEYEQCVNMGECRAPEMSYGNHHYYNYKGEGRGDYPVNGVAWGDAVTYCKWKGKALPTEAQWEKAARGTDGRRYPWGNEDASCARAVMDEGVDGCGENRTWRVGSKPEGVSPYGAHDMAGNVWEWTADWFDSSYYASAPGRDPVGPEKGFGRVVRGGGWYANGYYLRAANRNSLSPDRTDFDVGFRCVGTP